MNPEEILAEIHAAETAPKTGPMPDRVVIYNAETGAPFSGTADGKVWRVDAREWIAKGGWAWSPSGEAKEPAAAPKGPTLEELQRKVAMLEERLKPENFPSESEDLENSKWSADLAGHNYPAVGAVTGSHDDAPQPGSIDEPTPAEELEELRVAWKSANPGVKPPSNAGIKWYKRQS